MRLRNIPILLRLGRVRSFESRRDTQGAFEAIRTISNDGPLGGVVLAYTAKLMAMTRHPDALEYVRSARQFITDSPTLIDYREYCASYCAYLECVLLRTPTDEAKEAVLSKPSTEFIRNSLLVI
jgi:hypothetical protein